MSDFVVILQMITPKTLNGKPLGFARVTYGTTGPRGCGHLCGRRGLQEGSYNCLGAQHNE